MAVILCGLGLFGLAIWFPPFSTTTGAAETSPPSVWPIYGGAGGLTLVALFLGQRWQWRTLARVLLVAAVAILVYGLITRFRELGPSLFRGSFFSSPPRSSARCRAPQRALHSAWAGLTLSLG
jgi:hypothetical protein